MMVQIRYVCLALLLTLLAAAPASAASPEDSGLTGQAWLDSTRNEKLAFLYGVANVAAIEQAIADRADKAPSIFIVRWMSTFKNSSPQAICDRIDTWYSSHPDQRNRHIFDVLWYEIFVPVAAK